MSRSIVITSGKGGVGKTTITANLGAYLALNGQRVVVMDVDIGLNNLDVVMGIESRVVYDLVDVIEGRCRLKQALIEVQSPNFAVLPSCHSYDRSKVNGQNIKAVVRDLMNFYDYVLIDCPAGIELGFHRAVQSASEAIVVVTPQVPSIRDADRTIGIIASYSLDSVGLVVNRVRGDLVGGADVLDAVDIAELCHVGLMGVVPEDDHIAREQAVGRLSDIGSESGRAFNLLSHGLITGEFEIFDYMKKYKGFFGMLRKGMRRMG